jgi:hypothetical protein
VQTEGGSEGSRDTLNPLPELAKTHTMLCLFGGGEKVGELGENTALICSEMSCREDFGVRMRIGVVFLSFSFVI